MQNYDTFLELREEFANGEQFNSAINENKRYVDSLSGRLNELKTIWTDIATTILNGDTLKSGLNVLISLSEKISDIVKSTEDLGMTVPTILGLVDAFKNFGKVMSATVKEDELLGKSVLSSTSTLQKSFDIFKHGWDNAQNGTSKFKSGLDALKGSVDKTKLGLKATGLMCGIFEGALIGLASYVVSYGIEKFIEWKNAIKDAHEELQTTVETTKSDTQNLRENTKAISNIAEEYDTLASKTKLTNEEYERFNELKKEVADLFPDLVSG